MFVPFLFLLANNPCQSGNLKDLNEEDRSASYNDATDKCDFQDLKDEWNFWYKVSGNAGNALAAVKAPRKRRCGTIDRVYLNASHPLPGDGQVTRKVCMATEDGNCTQAGAIQVINCGAFYLYKLDEMRRSCSTPWRYCTRGKSGERREVAYPFRSSNWPRLKKKIARANIVKE